MPPLSLKSVIPAVLADWYQIYLSEYVAPQGWLTSPNSCLAPRKSPAGILSTPSRVFISINTGVCTREGTRLLGSLISRCMLLTDQKTLQTNKKTSSSKTPGLFVGLAREGNRGSRWFTKKLWPLWWPSIKKFYFLLNKNKLKEEMCLNQADDQLESSQLPVSVYISVMRSTDAVLICMRNTKHFLLNF